MISKRRLVTGIVQLCCGWALGIAVAMGILAAKGADDSSAYRELSIFSDAFQHVRSDYERPVKDSDLIDAAIQGMVSSLDPHSSYMDAKSYNGEFQIDTSGQYGGVGIMVVEQDGQIRVVTPTDGMPAAKAGIKPNDRIVAIDGVPVAGHSFDDEIDKMRGAVGTKVVLTIMRAGEKKPITVALTRSVVTVDATTFRQEGNVGYIRIPGFNEHTAEGLEKAVRTLKRQIGPHLRGYVLDLRDDPGGILEEAVQVSDDFLDAGEIVSTRGRLAEDTQRYDANPGDIAEGKPIVVLINRGTASASEIVAGALQDHRRATILGMTSYGKGSVQTVIPLGEGQGALRLTTARYFTPSGHSIQAQGITPDIAVAQGNEEEDISRLELPSEVNLPGHLQGETNPANRDIRPVVHPAPGKNYNDFQLSYALDLLSGKMTVVSVTKHSQG